MRRGKSIAALCLGAAMTLSSLSAFVPALGTEVEETTEAEPVRIAHFTFDSDDGGFSGDGATAISQNGYELTDDAQSGKALKLDVNQKQWLDVKSTDSGKNILAGLKTLSVSYWAKIDNTKVGDGEGWTFYAAADHNGSSYPNEHYLAIKDQKQNITVQRWYNSGSRRPDINQNGDYSGWRMVTVTESENESKLYVNGELITSLSDVPGLSAIVGGENGIFQIGKADWGSGEFLNAVLDEYSVWSGVLSDTSIKSMYDEQKAEFDATQEAYQKKQLDEEAEKNKPENHVADDMASLDIPNADDIRGNIYLASEGEHGSTITWKSSDASVITDADSDEKKAGVVTRGGTDKTVTLTATVTYGDVSDTKDFTVTVRKKAEQKKTTHYLFAFFKGENNKSLNYQGEQIYFDDSEDGLHWYELNHGKAVISSTLGDKGLRDPFIIRSAEGDKFYMIATDLRIDNGAGWGAAQYSGSKYIEIWESTDLVNWSAQRQAKVATADAGCTWAPEAVYDDTTGEYMVFWASMVNGVHHVFYCTTRDFYHFSDTKEWITLKNKNGKVISVIDTTVTAVENPDGSKTYYRMSKVEAGSEAALEDGDHENGKYEILERSDSLLGTWTRIKSQSLNDNQWVEGGTIFKFNDDDSNGQDKWCLLLDNFGGIGYYPLWTTDLGSGEFTRYEKSEYSFPSLLRHGTVIPITDEEFQAVEDYYGSSRPEKQPESSVKAVDVTTDPISDISVKTGTDKSLKTNASVDFSDGSKKTDAQIVWYDEDGDQVKNTKDLSIGVHKLTGKLSYFGNPVIAQRADPYIVYNDEDGYYYFTSSWPAYNDAEHGYDRLVLRRSKTLEGLADACDVEIWHAPSSGALSHHIWAPELHKINGSWYMFFAGTVDNSVWSIRCYVMKCNGGNLLDKASWETPVRMSNADGSYDKSFDTFSLDMTTFEVNGTYYAAWAYKNGSSVIKLAKLNADDPSKLASDAVTISAPEYSWEMHGNEKINEGPGVLIKGDHIYMTYSGSTTGPEYCMGLLSTTADKNLLDPHSWKKNTEPVLQTSDLTGEYGPGHNNFTTDKNGNTILVYHSRDEKCYENQCAWASAQDLYDPCRNANLAYVRWSEDGQPVFNSTELKETADLPTEKTTYQMTVSVGTKKELEALNKAIDDSELAALSFDDEADSLTGNGVKAADVSGAGFTLTEGKSGKALTLDGSKKQYLTLTKEDGSALLSGKNELTISFWSKTKKSGTNWAFYAAPDENAPTYQKETYLGITDPLNGNIITVERYKNTDSRPSNASASDPWNDEWKYVTVVESADRSIIYINGRKMSEVPSDKSLSDIFGTDGIVQIGKANWGNGEYFTGSIDELRIYDKALNSDEVTALYGRYSGLELPEETLEPVEPEKPDPGTGGSGSGSSGSGNSGSSGTGSSESGSSGSGSTGGSTSGEDQGTSENQNKKPSPKKVRATKDKNGVYRTSDGEIAANTIVKAKGKLYITDADGKALKNTVVETSDGKKYVVKSSGVIAKKEIVKLNGKRYYADSNGRIKKNAYVKVKGSRYFTDENGAVITGKWVKKGNKKYYCSKSGKVTKTKKIKK
ncbi:MAG: family 43 glycosylhydrolase [Lachnospiraceae bacterium]|nr:family 43 glycosylhydrolase [Lachnospiraceae bacterium]